MHNDDTSYAFPYLILDIVIFMAAVSIISFLFARGIRASYKTAEEFNNNTTMTENNNLDETYTGYTPSGGDMMFEGTISGEDAYVEIIRTDRSVAIEVNSLDIGNGLVTRALRDSRAGRSTALTQAYYYFSNYGMAVNLNLSMTNFARENVPEAIYEQLNPQANYVRETTLDNSGKIQKINYRELN